MLTKVVPTGNNPGGLLRYLMDEEKEFELYGGNIAGQTYGQIMAEWRAISQQNSRTDKDTKHVTMSPHISDRLTPDDWLDIGEVMVNGLGYTNNLWLIIKHKPTESQLLNNPDAPPHVHIMIHTFECENFTRINDWQDKTKAEKLTREIEQRWNLYQVTPSSEAEYSAPTTGQKRRMMREQQDFETGLRDKPPEEPTKLKLERLVVAATRDNPSIITFVARLQDQGVDVYPTIIGDEMKGLAFEYEGFRCRGSSLKNCSWRKLQEVRAVSYDKTRDLPILRTVAAGEKVQMLPEEEEDSQKLVSISANQIECTEMFASDINELLLLQTDRYLDSEFTALRISSDEISLRRTPNQSEILRAKRNGDAWEALPTESEMTSWEVHAMIALTENLIKELESQYWEQQQRVDIVAPIVAAILNLEQTNLSVGKYYTAEWDEECLTLWETGSKKPIMKAEWDDENRCWFENGSSLTQETTNYFQEKVLPFIRQAMQQKREREVSDRHQKSKQQELEL